MENWIKHELFHSNNEVSWWHDMTHDNMSSHDIRHMTSRHDFMNIKFDIWLLLYVAVSESERWFYLCFCFRSRNTFLLSPIGWPSRMHSRVTLKLKVTSWSTWPLLSLLVFVLPRWFFLFRKDFRSGNSFQLSPFAWPSRLTLKLNVTSWSTWHMSFLPVFVLPQRFFCFVGFLGQIIHSNYCHSRDFYIWPWNSGSRHGLRDFCYFWALVCVIRQWFFVLSGFQVEEFFLTIATCLPITCDFET